MIWMGKLFNWKLHAIEWNTRKYWQLQNIKFECTHTICVCYSENSIQCGLCPQFQSLSQLLCDCQSLGLNYHKIITMKNQNFRQQNHNKSNGGSKLKDGGERSKSDGGPRNWHTCIIERRKAEVKDVRLLHKTFPLALLFESSKKFKGHKRL